jgi:hypothetical protein
MAYIQYAKGGTDYRTKGTISCWVKRSSTGVQQDIWSWGENNSSDAYLRFDTADNIEINCDGAGTSYNSTTLYRDNNAWYHFVFSLDGSNATANLRRRFWINGVQQDEGQGSINAFSAAVFGWHSTQDLWIGARARSQQGGDIESFDGLMSHFHYCSNHSYAASDFGSFDSTTGEWKINTTPNVQYGSEGFFLKMEDSSNLDLDSSGNNKTLTTTGTITATKDCPSNVFTTLNSLSTYKGSLNFSNGNLTMTTDGGGASWTSRWGVSNLGMVSGKYYAEAKVVDIGSNQMYALGLCKDVGTFTPSSSVAAAGNNGLGYYSTGNIYTGGAFGNESNDQTSLATYTTNDIIGLAFDRTNGTAQWYKNGSAIGSAVTGLSTDGVWFFVSNFYNTGTVSLNFGNGVFGTTAVSSAGTNASNNGIFEYDVPANYTALSTKGLNL